MDMKNRNIYMDAMRWMLFPVLINVFYELLKITMIFITASFWEVLRMQQ
mgnify:CR=1 FL=1